MEEIDRLFETAPFTQWHSYSVVFGRYRLYDGEKEATILISIYRGKFDPIQRKFTGQSFSEAMEHLKRFINDPEYVQKAFDITKSETSMLPEAKTKRKVSPQNLELAL